MNRKLGSTLVKGNGKENLTNYIQLAIVAEKIKRNFLYIFDKKLGKYAGSTRFMISILNLKHCY
jgi:hypothetical protein